ncbi:MAG: hypothetical protein HY079_09845 [Elusimicrobia bacterium]|nr:hypothetical protein [Elusimicrobiota bacterium]
MDALAAALALLFAAALALGGPPRFLPPWTAAFLLSAAMLARVWRRERAAGRDPLAARPDAVLFWGGLTLYLASFRWHGGDDIPNGLLPFQLWRHGTLAFDELRAWATAPGQIDLILPVNGRLLSAYPVAPGVLAAPLYLIPALAVPHPSDAFLHNLAKVSGALITAASVVVFRRAAEKRCSPRWAFDCAVLYGLGSYAYSVSSQALYSHAPAALGVALGLYGLFAEGAAAAAAAGFGLALAWACREDSLVFAGAGAAYLLFHDRRRLPAFAAGALLPVALNLAYWRGYTGAFHPPYYALQRGMFVLPDWEAAAAMLVSPTRGFLFFFPAAAFGGWGAWRALRRPGGAWALYFLGACLATWLAFSMRTSWTAGNTFGDRYFAVVCLVLAMFCAELEAEVRATPARRAVWSAVLAYSVMIHAAGAHFQWPGYRDTLGAQKASTWAPAMYAPVFLFSDGGPIDRTPMPWRLPYGAALLAAPLVLTWRWSRRRLSA